MSDVFTLRGPIKKERPEPVARSVARKSLAGVELGTVELEPTIFGIEPNIAVLHQVIKAQLAAKRAGTQSTKTRKEVRGGGKKPFNQKGTGNARQGTIRAPHYPGGGIALGTQASQVRPEDPQEDDSPRAVLGALGPRVARARRGDRRVLATGRPPRPKRRSRHCARSGSTARSSSCSGATTTPRVGRSPISRTSRPSTRARSTPTTSWTVTGCSSVTPRCPPRKGPSNARRHEHPHPSGRVSRRPTP